MCDDCDHIDTPLNAFCLWCEEPIGAGDNGVVYDNGPSCHLECHLRQIIGSACHVLKTCSCFVPGSDENDPPELTKREASKLAVELAMQKMNRAI